MTSSQIAPPLLKGAIVGIDPVNPVASVVVFQYNPDTMSRTLTPLTAGGDAGPLRLLGPPQEAIKLSIELDAADQMQPGDALPDDNGVFPALAALEMLIYPKSALVIANEVLARIGVVEVIPAAVPMTLLIWGLKRIVPVRITEFSITEEAYNLRLNPVRAKVDLGMQVLTYHDLGMLSPGGALFMAHQIAKEVMATIGSAGAVPAVVGNSLGL